jgi:hypothetical protein
VWLAGASVYDVRNLIEAGPFAAVAVASLVARLPGRLPAVGCAALCCLLVLGFVRSNRATPAYDRLAQALVAEGWRAGDPIVVDGDPNALWGPLEWYLPGRPRFVVQRRMPAGDAPSFVVAVRGTRWTVARFRPGGGRHRTTVFVTER